MAHFDLVSLLKFCAWMFIVLAALAITSALCAGHESTLKIAPNLVMAALGVLILILFRKA